MASPGLADDFRARFKETYASPLTVKREAVYEFAQGPQVSRRGDHVEVAFAAKGWCDVTVAVEDEKGGILRHLGSGVLGPNAPEPFQKNTLRQTLVWDGKNDRGAYIDEKDRLTIRVSLGLKPQFERTLFHSPYKRFGHVTILMDADPEGVYVYDVNGDETVRLCDHRGDYVRTVYPFPAGKVDQVKMPRLTFPDGATVPAKRAHFLATLLTGPESGTTGDTIHVSSETTAMTVRNGRIALVGPRLNRMMTDGTTGDLDLYGPPMDVKPGENPLRLPYAAAFSPDHTYLYLARIEWMEKRVASPIHDPAWNHCVYRVAYAKNEAPAVFLGKERERGKDNAHFDHPADVAVDAQGRVYVADHLNDRIQVFAPDGTYLKTIPVDGPAQVRIHEKTQEVYVFSWFMSRDQAAPQEEKVAPTLTRFGPFPNFERRAAVPLPLREYKTHNDWSAEFGFQYRVALDAWAEPTRIWMVLQAGAFPEVFEERNAALVQVRDHLKDATQSGIRLTPPVWSRQRLYVDHRDGVLFLGEGDCGTGKAFTNFVRIDPETGFCRTVELPFSASDAAFAPDGLVHLRTGSVVGRYDPKNWTEVPFDYGEELGAKYEWDAKGASLAGGLRLPSTKTDPNWHHGGMDVNAKGDLLVTCYNPNSVTNLRPSRRDRANMMKDAVVEYRPPFYPGRWASGLELHVWDEHGLIKHKDILPGQPAIWSGATLDERGNVYVNVAASLMWKGRPYFQVVGHPFDKVGTLIKFKPGAGRFTKASAGGTRIPLGSRPNEPTQLNDFYVEGAEWLYPGVGRAISWACSCWNSRFALDYFARSFAPEYDRFSVAVLDTNGNLITRIGRYGNVDDGVPMVQGMGSGVSGSGSEASAAGPQPPTPKPQTRSLGGDEVGLFDACYLATHTDRRLFIADAGNSRILSVKLDYHTTSRTSLKDVKEGKP